MLKILAMVGLATLTLGGAGAAYVHHTGECPMAMLHQMMSGSCSEGKGCCGASAAPQSSEDEVQAVTACCAGGTLTSCQAPAEPVDAAVPAGTIVISVEEMDCPSCAKKIVTKLTGIPGVDKVTADVETSKLTVASKGKAAPSPKSMWQAVEKAGFKPTKIAGNGWTYTSLPKE